MEENLVSLIVS